MLYLTFLMTPLINFNTSTVHPTYFGIFLAAVMIKFFLKKLRAKKTVGKL